LAAIELHSSARSFKTEVYWYYGPTGTGKSRAANVEAPHAYWKSPVDKWWDGYSGQEDVIVDDYRRDLCTFATLLRLFDRYPLRVEYKGGSCEFRSKRIFITSPKSPKDTWTEGEKPRTDEDIQQLLRRITKIVHFDALVVPERVLSPVSEVSENSQS